MMMMVRYDTYDPMFFWFMESGKLENICGIDFKIFRNKFGLVVYASEAVSE